jgi:hypothetical protein
MALAVGAFGACRGTIGDTSGTAAATGSPGSPTGAASGSSVTLGSGASSGSGAAPTTSPFLPARIRRITDAEFDSSVTALLGIDSSFGAAFTPDTQQDGFNDNDAQRVDPVFAQQVDTAAQALAAQARMNVTTLAPCTTTDPAAGEACARTFLATFAAKAYRRPPESREIDALITVYHAGADGLTFADGIQAVVQAVLESPGFLYVTEIGAASGASAAVLTPYETASAIAYLFTGGPPDVTLIAAAAANQLSTAAQRTAQARRLLALPSAGTQIASVIEQWLGIEDISDTAKDTTLYPGFAALRPSIKKEADDFITQVMGSTNTGVADLLSADWTIANADLAAAYGGVQPSQAGQANARVSLTALPRRGVLDQAAFLSVYARAQETAPVLRGVAVMRRVACINVAAPTTLNLNIVPPVPDPTKTTRQRFDIHQTDPVCASCHKGIDGFGFAFENFDAMGMVRSQENGLNVDSSTTVAVGSDFDGTYPDSATMMTKMAKSPSVASCFARHMLKFAVARSDATETPVETSFLTAWQALSPAAQGNFGEILVAWVAGDAFVQRRFVP